MNPYRGLVTPEQLIDELTYVSYATNRQVLSAERMAVHYPNAAAMEARYLAEKAIAKAGA